MLRFIPNAITLCNLLCGCIAIVYTLQNKLETAVLWVLLGLFLDFFDGLAARVLKVDGLLGKQLDSLADVVTFGVVPAFFMVQMIFKSIQPYFDGINSFPRNFIYDNTSFIPYIGLLIALASAYRLAKFNIDTRQTNSFIGLPTPANALWIISLPMIPTEWTFGLLSITWVLIGLTLLSCYLLNANIPLFSLKFKKWDYRDNMLQYHFVILSIVLLALLQFAAVPIIIFLYVLTSLFFSRKRKIN